MEQLSMKWENGEVPCIVCDEDIQIRSYSPKDREPLKTALLPLTEKRFSDAELELYPETLRRKKRRAYF